jgi:hypothetical protein
VATKLPRTDIQLGDMVLTKSGALIHLAYSIAAQRGVLTRCGNIAARRATADEEWNLKSCKRCIRKR